jgi:hypothetical protein
MRQRNQRKGMSGLLLVRFTALPRQLGCEQCADFWQGLINRALQRMLHSIFISSPFHKRRWYSRSPGT